MANVLATTAVVAKEALMVLENMCVFSKTVNRSYESEFTSNMSRGYAPGNTINVKRPPRYTYRAGRVSVPQATTQTTVPITLSQGGNDIQFTSQERTVSVSQLEDIVVAAVAPVANEIDRQGLTLAHFATFNTLNPTGTLPTTAALAIQAMTDMGRRLDEMAAPRDNRRNLVTGPGLNGALVQGFGGYFNNQQKISDQNRSGLMTDNNFGFTNVGMDQNVDTHTNGTQNVAGTNVNGAGQTGAAITVVGLGGSITRGTVVTFPGVFAVNPQSRTSTGVLAQFVVTADLAAAAVSIPISPAIVVTGAFQNVTASPTTGQPFLIVGAASTAYQTNVAFHRDAFTLAMVPLYEPAAGTGARCTQMSRNGFTIKVTDFYDGINDNNLMRLDVLFGWAALYPELSVKYYSV